MICTSVWPYLPLKKAYGLMRVCVCLYGGAARPEMGHKLFI